MKKKYTYHLDFKVRDYECDLQGVVNNANYQRYMEHTRHEFWLELGCSFADKHQKGLDLFVYKVSITYKNSLRSGDLFTSALRCYPRGAKLIFEQALIKKDGTLAAIGEIEVVAVLDGVLTRGEYFEDMMQEIRERFPELE